MPYTPQKTLKRVLDGGNDYLVAVKRNQAKLYEHLETVAQYRKPLSVHEDAQRQRGRQEHRRVRVYAPCGLDEMEWVGVQSILCVERWGLRTGKPYESKAYYISSLVTSALHWQGLIRGHWGIENRLHWPKDVVFGEDDYRLEDGSALVNWSMIRTIVINILRLNGFQSLKTALVKLANRVDVIFSLLT
jgi:predicted transposase YbfD/YdcC